MTVLPGFRGFDCGRWVFAFALAGLLWGAGPAQTFAAGTQNGPLLPQDQRVATGMKNCVENVASCTDTSRLSAAWTNGMQGASVALKNFLNLLWSLIRQQPIPATPVAPPGMPPLPDYPIRATVPAPTNPTGTQPAQTP